MELKNYLIDLLFGIIQDKLKLLDDAKKSISKANDYKKLEEYFSDVNKLVDVNYDELKECLLEITDSETIDAIISNIEMIKIVENGIKEGLDLSLDDSQLALVDGVYKLVNDYRVELESKNLDMKKSLEDFISKCEQLSKDIGTGVVKDIDTLNEIFNISNVSKEDSVKAKFEILKNNSKNYNMNINNMVKEELDLRIIFKQYDINLDDFSSIEKDILIKYCSVDSVKDIMECLVTNNFKLELRDLFIIVLFSNISIISNVIELCNKYGLGFYELFKIPSIFVDNKGMDLINNIINDYNSDDNFYIIEFINLLNACSEIFVKNISLLEKSGRRASDCFKYNLLSLIVPDMEKNITILEGIDVDVKDFSVIVINPYLATSRSSFIECGLGEYLKNNPLRLCTSYFRLKKIVSNIVFARKNGQIIFRSLSDKKNYWLAKNITRNGSSNVDEVI